ncbi:hypothetical protein [Glycomyces albidus]|uniref:Pentapeptide repeat-containing protein n=1 Tax=Glycomyces albidus TaxID=2656774 RepID=A0A6L5GEZ7_9ACTN|nr:hypothetical protein [Glycomyces albidus]MQM28166.1 hypothetical protein [Glycomyces albidus]
MGKHEPNSLLKRVRASLRWINAQWTQRPLLAHVLLVLTLAAGSAVVTGGILWSVAGGPSLPPISGESARLELIKVSLLVTGGIGGVVALVVTYRRQQLGEREERREDTRLMHDRFREASAQLGEEAEMSQTAGIIALASLADDWPEQRQMCVDLLCAFIQKPLHTSTSPSEGDVSPTSTDADLESSSSYRLQKFAISEIRKRLDPLAGAIENWTGLRYEFSISHIDKLNLSHTNLTDSQLIFRNSSARESVIDFSHCKISGTVIEFDETFSLPGGKISFSGAKIHSSEIRFKSVRTRGVTFAFDALEFYGGLVDFDLGSIENGHFSAWGAEFHGGTFRVNSLCKKVDFHFRGSEFSGGVLKFELSGGNKGWVEFHGIDLKKPPQGVDLPWWIDEYSGFDSAMLMQLRELSAACQINP